MGADAVALNGAAGVPTMGSWWNASSSAFLTISNCVELRLLSYEIPMNVSDVGICASSVAYIGAQEDGTLQERPCCEVRALLLYG